MRILILMALVAVSASAAEEVLKHPDGTIMSRCPLDQHQLRNGAFVAYHPGGKKVAEKSTYRAGALNGSRQRFDEKGVLIADETWVEGRLVFPKSIAFIDQMRKRIAAETPAQVAAGPVSGNPRAPKLELQAQALTKLRFFRFLCDVPWDVELDPAMTDSSQRAADLLAKLGRLEWNPSKPAGMADDAFALARKGCAETNQCAGKPLVEAIETMFDDSDAQNRDRLLHRRKMLDPKMRATGFGETNGFVTMYSADKTRPRAVDFEFIAYPPAGYCPSDCFEPTENWHISFSPQHYDLIADGTPMDIYPLDASLKRAARPLELDYRHVGFDDFGIPGAIVIRPKDFKITKGALYEVVVTGLKPKDGHPAEVAYVVSFY